MGSCARLTFYVDQTYAGEEERAIVARLVMPITALPAEWAKMASARQRAVPQRIAVH